MCNDSYCVHWEELHTLLFASLLHSCKGYCHFSLQRRGQGPHSVAKGVKRIDPSIGGDFS